MENGGAAVDLSYQGLVASIKEQITDINLEIKLYDVIDSTNNEAKRYAAEAQNKTPVLFVADEQSAGRGRVGRSFISRRDRGIYMTLLYFADGISNAVGVTTHAAVAVATSIEEICGKKMRIKWVNDIFDEYGKVSGILVEGQPANVGYAVAVGVGINIGGNDFPDEIRGIASSIGEFDVEKAKLISLIVTKLLTHAKNPDDKSYMSEYRDRFMLDGKDVVLSMADGGERFGRVVGVTDGGGLIIDTDCGREVIVSGSVSVRIKGER